MMYNMKDLFPLPPCKFNDYKDFKKPTYHDWFESVTRKTSCLLHINKWLSETPSEDQKIAIYKKCLSTLKKPVKGAGTLITNHSMGIMASLGMLPFWIGEYALIPHDSKYMTYFKQKFGWETLDDDTCTSIAMHLMKVIRSENNLILNLRQMENLLCKYYRHVAPTSSDSKWYEMMMLFQPKIAIYGEQVTISSSDGKLHHGNGSLIKLFPYRKDAVSIIEFVNRIGVEVTKNLPVEKKLFGYRLPSDLIYNVNATKVVTAYEPPLPDRAVGKNLMHIIRNANFG